MRILIVGASGQLGFELQRALLPLGTLITADRSADPQQGIALALDLADSAGLAARLAEIAPDIIVNAAAHTAVDLAEDEVELSDALNHRAVAAMAQWCAARQSLLVHYSTDYVFAGDGTAPYPEDHPTGPRSVYGRSKLAGEQALAASGCDYLLLRTAWVYAARGRNFLLTMLRAAAVREELAVVDDQIGTPTTARFLAQTSAHLLQHWLRATADERARLRGACHVVMGGAISWCGFAREIIQHAHALGLLERATPVRAIRTGEYPAKAPRPAYSVLDTHRLQTLFGVVPPDWRVGLMQTLLELADARRALTAAGFEIKRC